MSSIMQNTITFCGSVANYAAMEGWAAYLGKYNIVVHLPVPGHDNDRWEELGEQEKRAQRRHFLQDHVKYIDQSDIVFVFNIHGRIGVSATIEIGYALAKGKCIYALQRDDDIGRDIVFEKYCGSKEELLRAVTR